MTLTSMTSPRKEFILTLRMMKTYRTLKTTSRMKATRTTESGGGSVVPAEIPNRPLELGDRVRIRPTADLRGRIVELRDPLGPGGSPDLPCSCAEPAETGVH